jgi:hypothetical protein
MSNEEKNASKFGGKKIPFNTAVPVVVDGTTKYSATPNVCAQALIAYLFATVKLRLRPKATAAMADDWCGLLMLTSSQVRPRLST